MASWDDEDYDSEVKKVTSQWEGEDEEDIVDDWEAEVNGEPADTKTTSATTGGTKKRRTLKDIIAEKEAKARELAEQKKKEQEEANDEEDEKPMSELQRQKMAEEAELFLLQDTFGSATELVPSENSIDHFSPQSREDFQKFGTLVRDKLMKYEQHPYYPFFLEGLFREVVIGVDMETLRNMSTMFSAMASQKQKQQKATKSKKNTKTKLPTVRDKDFNTYDDDGDVSDGLGF